MNFYLNRAILLDVIFVILIGALLICLQPYLSNFLEIPNQESINSTSASLISIGATLIGFLLTIITILVTFKKGYDDVKPVKEDQKTTDFSEIPSQTIFDKKVSKEEQFYGTDLYKRVLKVFLGATYEIGLVILILLIIQFHLIQCSQLILAILTLQSFIMIFLSTFRSINIFRLYLNVHIIEHQ